MPVLPSIVRPSVSRRGHPWARGIKPCKVTFALDFRESYPTLRTVKFGQTAATSSSVALSMSNGK